MSLDFNYSLLNKQIKYFVFIAAADQSSFSGADSASNSLTISDNAVVKVYVNDQLQSTGFTLDRSGDSVTFDSALSLNDSVKIVVEDTATDNDFYISIQADAEETVTQIKESAPGYDPADTNTYYTKIRLTDTLDELGYAKEEFATGAALSALNSSTALATSLFLEERNRAVIAEANAITTANAYTDTRETAITTAYQAYADQAEVDAKAYTDTRETAITTAYQAYADQAEVDAKAYTDTRETAITTAYQAADTALDTRLTTAETTLQNVISNTDAAALDSLTEIVTAFETADSNLNNAITSLATAAETARNTIQAELDVTQTGAGLGTDGTYTANGSANYISAATSLKDADNKLDAQIKTVADSVSNLATVATTGSYNDLINLPEQDVVVSFGGNAPENASAGDLWFDDVETALLYVYTADGIWLSTADGVGDFFEDQDLDNIGNVDTTGKSDGNVLTWDNTAGKWVAAPTAATYDSTAFATDLAAASIDDLSDVDTTTSAPQTGDALVWDGTKFVPQAPFSQSDFDTAFSGKNTDSLSEGTTNLYYTDERVDDRVAALITAGSNITVTYDDAAGTLTIAATEDDLSNNTTDDLAEGTTNLYYTEARVDANFATKDTDDLAEGTTNLYYTEARVDANFATKTTTDLTEGTNLYYTDTRVNDFLAGGTAGNIVTTGYIAGPSTFTIDPAGIGDNTGTVVILGNLQVDGTTTTINSTTITVSDLNVVLGEGSTNAAASNGGGISLNLGSDGFATISYNSANDTWEFNKTISGQIDDISNHSTTDLTEGTNLYYTEARVDANFATKDTDDLAEGTTNLYYTDTRVADYLSTQGFATSSWTEVTSATHTATAGQKLVVDTTTNAVTITLPTSADFGKEIRIIDGSGNSAANNITITSAGKINGSDSDMIVNVNGSGFGLVYYNATRGWVLIDK